MNALCLISRYRRHLTPYIDGELDRFRQARVERHLEKCARCRKEYDRLLFASRIVSQLALPAAPPTGVPAWPGPPTVEARFRQPWKKLVPVAAAILLVAIAIAYWYGARARDASWEVVRLSGAPRINSNQMNRTGQIKEGDWLETDEKSKAMLNLGILGQVEVDPDTRIRLVTSRSNEQKLVMTRGRVFASIMAPPRIFFIETPSGIAIDLGCAYTLEVDDSGQSTLYVAAGAVALAYNGREAVVPADAVCRARPGSGPGTPYSRDASERLQTALAEFDFGDGASNALQIVIAEARVSDGLTLWSLLKRVEGADRDRVYDRLAQLISPPQNVTKDGVFRRDQKMLNLWLQELDKVRVNHFSNPEPAPGAIRFTGNMETDRSWHRSTLLPDGKVFVTGGLDSYGNALASAEIYDPATGQFTPAGTMNSRRAGHTATLLPNGLVLIAGGAYSKNDWETLSSAEIYDPATGRFTQIAGLKTARMGHEATLLSDKRVLITGGTGANRDIRGLRSAEIYDSLTGVFTETGHMSEPRLDHTATLLPNGSVLITGGYSIQISSSELASTAELYDPATNSFSLVASMNFYRYKHSAVLLSDGRVLIAGGIATDPGKPRYTTAEIFDPATNSFVKTGDMILDRFKVRNGAVLLKNGKVLIAGGSWGLEVYDPATGRFSFKPSQMMTRYYSTATLLANGEVVIIGGYSGIQPQDFYHSSASAWIYSPE
ncbi:MAG: kelch repeat-containing protein [Blastocatellia bacterium]